MNNTKIEWCDMTWNPVTGCYHGCDYCYGERIVKRFTPERDNIECIRHNDPIMTRHGRIWELDGQLFRDDYYGSKIPHPFWYEPTFYRYRLNEPLQRKKPTKIFVVSMGDLFGAWVPYEWINQVFDACEKAPQHTYFFLTKNPDRVSELMRKRFKMDYPENWWIGTSMSGVGTDFERIEGLWASHNTFWSIEPLLKNPKHICGFLNRRICDGACIPEWVIVGGQTGPGAKGPKKEWVEMIIDHCRTVNVPIFLKDNLKGVWDGELIQEWPEGIV